MRWAWLTCASLSVAAHALTVSLLPSEERPTRRPGGPTTTAPAWHLRVVRADTLTPQATALTAGAATSVQASVDATAAPTMTEQADPPDSDVETQTEVAPAIDSTPDAPEPEDSPPIAAPAIHEASAAPGGASPVDWQGDSQYIPRPQLSLPPVPETPVVVPPPKGWYETGRVTGILSLYIDEQGRVHHVLPSGTPMPPPFEEAARQAFMSQTFRPGELNGQPVKSRIRIEVVFDNTPLDTGTPAR